MKIKIQNLMIPVVISGLFVLISYFSGEINYLDLFYFSAGLFLGVILMHLDEEILHKYYLENPKTKPNLITRSLIFIISLFPMGVYLITSTGSEIGIGFFLSIVSVLLLELIQYRTDSDGFHARFLFQLKRKLSSTEIKYFVSSYVFLVLIFMLMIFFLGR